MLLRPSPSFLSLSSNWSNLFSYAIQAFNTCLIEVNQSSIPCMCQNGVMHLRYLSLDWNILHTFSFALQKIKFLSLPFWEHIVYYIWYLRCLIVCACITWVISYELLVCVCTLESDFHCFGFIWIKIWSSSVWTFISFCLLYDTRDRRTHVLVLVHARFYRIAQAKYSKWWNGNKEPNMTKTKWQHEPCNEI